ncbi:cytochrome c [bacterium]|nr:cytochrome c [bacterium]
MSRWHVVNGTLLLTLIALVGLNLVLHRDVNRRNVEFFPEMVHPVPLESYSSSGVFANGSTLQQPPEGTVPRGYTPPRYGPGEDQAELAGQSLHNPLEITAQTIERGNDLYRAFCLPCHGADGGGMGPVAMRGYPPPPPLLAENAVSLPDGRLYHIIVYGQANMPGYAAQIHDETDRWTIVHYLREMQGVETAGTGSVVTTDYVTRQLAQAGVSAVENTQ